MYVLNNLAIYCMFIEIGAFWSCLYILLEVNLNNGSFVFGRTRRVGFADFLFLQFSTRTEDAGRNSSDVGDRRSDPTGC